jgi:phytanoyl-CoA hydroxylase
MITATSNAELLKAFKTDGFVALPQFVGGEELTELLAHVERFISDIVPQLPQERVFYEDKNDEATLKQIQHMADHDPWFNELFTSSRFREVAQILLDGPVVPKNMQYFNKPPGVGQPTPPHQDGYYFMLDDSGNLGEWTHPRSSQRRRRPDMG